MLEEITKRPSAKVLILMNLLPLFGVIFWGWSIFNVVLLYWMENLVLGVINILKMLTCRPDVEGMGIEDLIAERVPEEKHAEVREKLEAMGGIENALKGHSALKLFMIPFFTVHYFGFCAGHGFFVFMFFGGKGGQFGNVGSGVFDSFGKIPGVLTGWFALAALGLVASHLFSFFSNYIGRGEYKKTFLPLLMFQPYGRIVVLHIAIIFGGAAVMALGSSMGLLLILIVGKIGVDLKMHLREHRKADVGVKPGSGSPLLQALMRG